MAAGRFLAMGLALAAAAPALAAPALAAPAPRYAATITRTTQGIPHIVARDFAGLGYGSGYSAAQDNGCVIAELAVTVRGERSLWFGAEGKVTIGFSEIPNLESDFYSRVIADLPLFEAGFRASSADNRAMLDGFAAGYNRFLRDHPAGLAPSCRGQPWVRPLGHDDMLLIINAAMVQASSAPMARFIAGAAPPARPAAKAASLAPAALIPADLPLPAPAAAQGLGSNGWAFGRDLTANRRGLVVGNPHFPWTGPNRFRRLHLTIPGSFDAMGAGLVFTPFVAIGFTRDVAWTHTVTTAQHFTLFDLPLDPADPTTYLVDGKPEKMTERSIRVAVKDGAPVTRTLYATRYGPAIAAPAAGLPWTATHAFAIRDAGQGNQRGGDAWLAIARARTVQQIRQAIGTTLGIPYVNTIAADRSGHALYADVTTVPNVSQTKWDQCVTLAGKTPIARNAGVTILDGSRAACDWDIAPGTPAPGLMPIEDQATLIRTDYVQNSNDSYWLSNFKAPFEPHSPLLGPWGTQQNMRTRIGISLLDDLKSIEPASARALILGNRVFAAELVLDQLLALCPARADLAPACAVLAKWDRHVEVDSRGALLFLNFWGRTGQIRNFWANPFDLEKPITRPADLNPDATPPILDALAAAAADMTQRGIALDAPLGSVQVSLRGGERIAIPGGPGSAGILNAMQSSWTPEGLTPVHGSSYMQVVSFDANGPEAQSMLSYSQSTNPESPWYADGTRAFSARQWLPLPFTRAQIAAAQVGKPLTISE
ncbi:penicillin acylase family protein [Sphingomonas sp. LB-2]|uniref:penicillin acylase family protein n=1 Tax=Sphingomonas caeni TaxID=2984949 RepID=UPI0022328974|nr:penicillin acylase family protein [Sphingomonas caeni]MCW3846442.1 penicillin acylase family protein [Sphingomonas caeni]